MDQLNLDNVSIENLRDGYKSVMGLLSGNENPNDTTIPRHMAIDAHKMRAAISGLQSNMMDNQGFYAHEDDEGPLSKIKKIADPKNKAPKSAGDQLYLKSFMVLFGANDQQQLFNTLNGVENAPSPLPKAPVGEVTRGSLPSAEAQVTPQDVIQLQAEALGFEGVYEAGLANHSSLQREFGLGLKDIANLSDLALEQKIMSELVDNVDHTKLFEKAMTGDVQAIKQMQAVVGAEITGELDSQTSGKFNDFIETHNPGIEGLRGHLIADDGSNLASTNSLYNAIKNGNVPIIESALPEHLKGLTDGAFEQDGNAKLLASHLAQETNFVKYDASLKAQNTASDIKLSKAFHENATALNETVLSAATGPIQAMASTSRHSVTDVAEATETAQRIDRKVKSGDIKGASAELNKHAVEGMEAVRTQQIGYVGKNLETFAEIDSFKGLSADQIVDKFNAEGLKRGSPLEQEILSKDTRIHDKMYGSGEFGSYRKQFMQFEQQQQTAENNFQKPAPVQSNSSGGLIAGIKSFFTGSANATPIADNQNNANPARRAAITGADNNNIASAAPSLGAGGGW